MKTRMIMMTACAVLSLAGFSGQARASDLPTPYNVAGEIKDSVTGAATTQATDLARTLNGKLPNVITQVTDKYTAPYLNSGKTSLYGAKSPKTTGYGRTAFGQTMKAVKDQNAASK